MMLGCDLTPTGEWLEQGQLDPEEVGANLRDLALINRWLGGSSSVLGYVAKAIGEARPGEVFRLVDLACGGGDMLRGAADRARQLGRAIWGVGVDANEHVLAYAKAASADYPELRWVRADALRLPLVPTSFDLVMCSCFLHHLDRREAAALMRAAATLTRRTVVLSDLVRSRLGGAGFRLLCLLARLHPVTCHDGLVSLRRAYRPEELAEIARSAGGEWELHHHRFCRVALTLSVASGAGPSQADQPLTEDRGCIPSTRSG
jgi:SAM-dependent methyltransferase